MQSVTTRSDADVEFASITDLCLSGRHANVSSGAEDLIVLRELSMAICFYGKGSPSMLLTGNRPLDGR